MPAGRRGATFYRCWLSHLLAVRPSAGPAVGDGGIDFKICLPILQSGTLPEYYEAAANFGRFQKGDIGNLIDDSKECRYSGSPLIYLV